MTTLKPSEKRLREAILGKGVHIVSTVVPEGYAITSDGRDKFVDSVVDLTAFDEASDRNELKSKP
jgi:hypothetical protein